jgi:G3E family GTPase
MVGGFLGAGKTTLLWESARRLTERGKRVGLITNDQAPDLVDTSLLAGRGGGDQRMDVKEVAGSCFCCNFKGLINAAVGLKNQLRADVLIAEPVGSCTDLSATLLQPLKANFKQDFAMSPLSVLADPDRLMECLSGESAITGTDQPGLHPDARYILRKQLEEADTIVVNKADLLDTQRRRRVERLIGEVFPDTPVRWTSALTGEGVDRWLDETLAQSVSGQKILDVDYDRYAHGEAVLGWLNGSYTLEPRGSGGSVDGPGFAQTLLEVLQRRIQLARAEVGHVKLLLSSLAGGCVANLTRAHGEVSLQRSEPAQADGSPGTQPKRAQMVLNARVQVSPEQLRQMVDESLEEAADHLAVRVSPQHVRHLSPGRPVPTHRYAQTVA